MANESATSTNAVGRDLDNQDFTMAAWQSLGQVFDPELGIDVVSLGLIYDVHQEDKTIKIKMTLTTPGCPASENLPEMALQAVRTSLKDQVKVDLQVVWDPPWDPSMMNPYVATEPDL